MKAPLCHIVPLAMVAVCCCFGVGEARPASQSESSAAHTRSVCAKPLFHLLGHGILPY